MSDCMIREDNCCTFIFVSYLCSMELFVGTSWGTMSILFPLLVIPTFQASNGNAIIFYSTIAGVLSGSVAGDHMSPISDTTVSDSKPFLLCRYLRGP
jgi:Na+/H+ antiporter NhaC